MKKIIILFSLLVMPLVLSAQLSGLGTFASPYSGTFQGDPQWNIGNFSSGKIYVGGDVTIDNEQLVIGAGMKIIFVAAGADLIINGTGRMDAIGTSGSGMIRFTADYDDNSVYGETGERWGHIVFDNPSGSNQSTLIYCIIEYGDVSSGSNTTSSGGGIYTNIYSNLVISNCTIRFNKATHGGGIMALSGASPAFSNTLISENTVTTGGGGLYLHTNCTSTLTNCIIDNNVASGSGGGGGIFLHGCSNVRAINSNFVRNSTSRSDGGHDIQYYQITDASNRPRFINCISWGNDNSIAHLSCSPVSNDFVNSAIRDISTPASYYTSCTSLSSSNDLGGPNFLDPDLPGVDWSIKVISPCRDAGTDSYSGVTIPSTDIIGTSKLNTKDIGAYEVQYNYWLTSAGSADWATGANWNGGVPSSSQNVVIVSGATNYPTGSTSLDYTIGSGYGLVLEPGAKATFNTLTKSGDLKLMSNSSGISSLITNNSVSAIVELFLTGGGTITTYKWHYISTPVSTLPVTTFTGVTLDVVGFAEPRVSTDLGQGWVAWDGYVYATGGDEDAYGFSDLTPGKGYDYWDQLDQKFTFSGSLNVTNQAMALSYSGTANSGFNLLGNPFSSGLNWNAILSSGTYPYPANTSQGIYFTRNKTQCTYIGGVGIPSDVTGIIPPMQGFFVKTSSTGNTINLDPAARTQTNIHARYKGDEVIPLVRLSLSEDTFADETVVRFDAQAKSDLDYEFDATKIFFSTSNVGIYSEMGGTKYAINGQPFPDPLVEIPIVVNLTKDGIHALTSTQLQGLDDYNVYLTDNTTGFTADLKTTPALTFSASTGLITGRFILKVGNITTRVDNPIVAPDNIFNVYSGNNNINIQTISDDWDGKSGSVRVLDLTGKTASDDQNVEFSKNSLVQVQAPGATGLYVVEIRSGVMRYVGKVIIK